MAECESQHSIEWGASQDVSLKDSLSLPGVGSQGIHAGPWRLCSASLNHTSRHGGMASDTPVFNSGHCTLFGNGEVSMYGLPTVQGACL